jgi:hypothetical protein
MFSHMFDYPKQAELNRILPKNRIYAHARLGRPLRDRFTSQIGEIVWKYKLSAETVNLPARQGIYEIQVFVISLKTPTLAPEVLRTIDRSIPSPLFFELIFQDQVRFVAAYKRPGDSDASVPVVEAYFETPWRGADAPRAPLPVALDLASLYEQMLRRYIDIPPRAVESLRDQVERVSRIRVKKKECQRLEARLRRELQFNRKVEINAELRMRTSELAELQ